jgi:hypothetical protein
MNLRLESPTIHPDEFVIEGPANKAAINAYYEGIAVAAGLTTAREWFQTVGTIQSFEEFADVEMNAPRTIPYNVTEDECRRLLVCNPRVIKLKQVHMSDEIISAVLNFVNTSSVVTHLDLGSATISEQKTVECIELLRGHPTLRQVDFPMGHQRSLIDKALTTALHLPALRGLSIMGIMPFTSVDILVELIRNHRFLNDVAVLMQVDYDDSEIERIASALRQNWRMTFLPTGHRCQKCSDTDHAPCDIMRYLQRNKDMQWKNVHKLVLDACIALQPLWLSPYVVLWILDWLPPMHHRFDYRDDPDFDPHHVRKIRLIESVMK